MAHNTRNTCKKCGGKLFVDPTSWLERHSLINISQMWCASLRSLRQCRAAASNQTGKIEHGMYKLKNPENVPAYEYVLICVGREIIQGSGNIGIWLLFRSFLFEWFCCFIYFEPIALFSTVPVEWNSCLDSVAPFLLFSFPALAQSHRKSLIFNGSWLPNGEWARGWRMDNT